MAEKPRGMGRGLSAILSAAPRDESEELRTVPIDLIAPNPHQPRRHFEEEALVGARRVAAPPAASCSRSWCGRSRAAATS